PLSGALFFRSGATLTYYHGVSTRDPALTRCQGPSSMFWHAMRLARALGLRYFDHGAVTVTDDPAHPHYSVYDYKRRFGGHVEEIASGRLVLSPVRHAFQERLMMPVWKRLYPLYLRLGRVEVVPLRA
ncbi:MAG TPA: peptidoglycan bridge formation glycyltransferase FemA/FemB family protein, partial [Terriglobales bacterium]|nr:peptidoglycan bridge formation glycyltransferase FemA/FemB family protein [Terriglobales bacterium]